MNVGTSSWTLSTAVVGAVFLAACPAIGPTEVLVNAWIQPYMYEGEEVKLPNVSASSPELRITVRLRNLATQGSRELQASVTKQTEFGFKLDAATIPDLATTPGLVPVHLSLSAQGQRSQASPLGWAGTNEQKSEMSFKIVRDRDARLPPMHTATNPINIPVAGTKPAWAQVGDVSLMEDKALEAALTWGGRNLVVSKTPAGATDFTGLLGPDGFIPEVSFYWFDVAGTYPKHVVPATFSGAEADVIGNPKAVRVLVPQTRDPFPLRIKVTM